MTVREFTFGLVGAWVGAAAMFGVGTAVWPADHPGRTWVTLPRPAAGAERADADPGDRIPAQKLPVTP